MDQLLLDGRFDANKTGGVLQLLYPIRTVQGISLYSAHEEWPAPIRGGTHTPRKEDEGAYLPSWCEVEISRIFFSFIFCLTFQVILDDCSAKLITCHYLPNFNTCQDTLFALGLPGIPDLPYRPEPGGPLA